MQIDCISFCYICNKPSKMKLIVKYKNGDETFEGYCDNPKFTHISEAKELIESFIKNCKELTHER